MILLPVQEIPQWGIGANRTRTDCGPASVAMCLSFYGLLNGLTVDQLAAETTLKYSDAGLQPAALVTLAAKHGLTLMVHRDTTLDDLRSELDNGFPIIALIAYRFISGKLDKNDNDPKNDGHFFVVVGYQGDAFYVCDPDYWQPYTARGFDAIVPASEMDAAIGGGSIARQCLFVVGDPLMTIDNAKLTAWIAQVEALSADMKTELAALVPPVVVPPVVTPPPGPQRSAAVNAPGGLNAHVAASTSATAAANIPNLTLLSVTDTGITTPDGYTWEQVVTPIQYAKLFVVAKYLDFQ